MGRADEETGNLRHTARLLQGMADRIDQGEASREDLDAILAAIERGKTDSFPPEKVARVRVLMACSEHKRHTPPVYEPGRSRSRAGRR